MESALVGDVVLCTESQPCCAGLVTWELHRLKFDQRMRNQKGQLGARGGLDRCRTAGNGSQSKEGVHKPQWMRSKRGKANV